MSGVSPVLVEWFHGLAWGCWCGRDHGLGCPVGMSGSGMGMLLGSRTATPRVFCGAVRCPCVAAGPGWLVGSCGAWWFENWIVDASKRNFGFFLLIAISPNSSIEFGFEIDRFVIILVLRFVVWRSCYQETRGWGNDNLFCCCAACEGVWWMPWQTVPMKDV